MEIKKFEADGSLIEELKKYFAMKGESDEWNCIQSDMVELVSKYSPTKPVNNLGMPCGRPHCLGDFKKPVTDKGLIERLREYINRVAMFKSDYEAIEEILSKYEGQESLAELADRKGFNQVHLIFFRDTETHAVRLWPSREIERPVKTFEEKTYAKAESKAREYLMGLEDKNDKYKRMVKTGK